MAEDLVVIGAGGFGRETLDVIEAINSDSLKAVWNVVGVADDAPSAANLERLATLGVAYVGTTQDVIEDEGRPRFVVGIGSPAVRRAIADRLEAGGLEAATLIHPAATLGRFVTMGVGAVICAGARLTTNIALGRHVHLNPNVTIGHDTVLGDFVSVNPSASVSGDCTIADGVLVGVGAVVLNQLTVGRNAVIGGAACVVKDVPPDLTVKGVPAT